MLNYQTPVLHNYYVWGVQNMLHFLVDVWMKNDCVWQGVI